MLLSYWLHKTCYPKVVHYRIMHPKSNKVGVEKVDNI